DLVDLGDVAADMMRMFGGDAQAGKLALDILIPADMPKLRADPRAFRQVLMNLISNAVKVTPRGDRITVEADIVDDGLRVRVTDIGRGFSEAEMDTVLAPFGRLDQADTASVAGTGLGLPIVKSLMDLHDGTLALRSRPGAGPTATVVFPAARVDASPQQAAMSF
ncbi:MAG: ATP-binding protein, partial [Rhodospirillaceae bacterium]